MAANHARRAILLSRGATLKLYYFKRIYIYGSPPRMGYFVTTWQIGQFGHANQFLVFWGLSALLNMPTFPQMINSRIIFKYLSFGLWDDLVSSILSVSSHSRVAML